MLPDKTWYDGVENECDSGICTPWCQVEEFAESSEQEEKSKDQLLGHLDDQGKVQTVIMARTAKTDLILGPRS